MPRIAYLIEILLIDPDYNLAIIILSLGFLDQCII